MKEIEEERVSYMTFAMKLMDERKEGRAEGRAEGRKEEQWATALDMLRENEPLARIMKYAHLSAEEVAALAKQNGLAVS